MSATSEVQTCAGRLHLGCGERYLDGWHNVDAVASVDPDEVVDLNETPWPFPTNSARLILAEHVCEHLEDIEDVLSECQRILEPGGKLITRWPIGIDARADPDHEREWTWRTPEFWTGARHWDRDVGLTVVEREVDLWGHLPGLTGGLVSGVCKVALRAYGPGPWCFDVPTTSGVFTVVFENDG